MYATKPLSLFKSHPEAASGAPPEGRNSGYLVVKGAADEETSCWGLFPDRRVRELPFPQDRVLKVRASTGGLVRACSREEDKVTCCFFRCIKDVAPRPFDPADVYQQMEIVQRRRGWFTARAVAANGFPSSLYRSKYWEVYASKTGKFDLGVGDAMGMDAALRSRQLADYAFPVAATAAAVGKWYSPFFLIKEAGVAPREQMERSAFYEVTLELRWEPVHAYSGGGSKLASMRAYIGGSAEAEEDLNSRRHGDAYLWFKAAAARQHLGVCKSVLERMRWEESREGWVDEEDAEKVTSGGSVLVERFVVKRLDGSVVVAFDFLHLSKVRAKQL
ncbi:unnamed protein product [Miscanthus lutarioriparius]|uniref:Uncharacterized protein n=1 Tax=Miscanthus lutarioriparius TaxID=422564 RepID=A0A811PRL6_9POAL|nr:unnamed protein product [Miscanthus lutarioriparius]